jgi:hypothetical protein
LTKIEQELIKKLQELIKKLADSEAEIDRLLRAETIGVKRSVDEKLELCKRNLDLNDEVTSLTISMDHIRMFFQIATDNLGFDASCEPGKIDSMCVAEAIRSLNTRLFDYRKTFGTVISMAGHPDPAEACRNIIIFLTEKLDDKETK